MTTRNFGKTLAYQKFSKTIENQIRNFWQIHTSLIYAERWWGTIQKAEIPSTIAKFPGDNTSW